LRFIGGSYPANNRTDKKRGLAATTEDEEIPNPNDQIPKKTKISKSKFQSKPCTPRLFGIWDLAL
jgi:hypothetical protein